MKNYFPLFLITILSFTQLALGQVFSYTTMESGKSLQHVVLMDEVYFVETQFTSNPNEFVKTIGGYYQKKGDDLMVNLEFNSEFSKDSLKNIVVNSQNQWQNISKTSLPLQGKWMMAGRVNGDKERRKDMSSPRKTIKILIDGYFQWIAFNTATFSFHGSGGGRYTAEEGRFTETINYFSRDNNKVGISLGFEYEIIREDWHHKGFSSKGDPLHEIWKFITP